MSVQLIESELLEELSTEEQELLSGGQNFPLRLRGRLRDREGNRYRVRLNIFEIGGDEDNEGFRGDRERLRF